MTSVTLGKWLVLIGGHGGNSDYREETYFVTGNDQFMGPKLAKGREQACAAVIKEEGDQKWFAVVGGKGPVDQSDNYDMEVFVCDMKGQRPDCKKEHRQTPTLSQKFVYFGCGVLKTDDGKNVLLVMGAKNYPEILDVTATNWVWKTSKF